ncbi:MAG TPA: hypothetical protein DIW77_12025 [Chromatiaceae bacterium]|jgi:hypothetical protein|nr:hypothetical protein [Chromatiaceae bacterium]
MRVILHIGVHKTGTSAIQEFLYKNSALLHAQGFLYPRSGRFHLNHNPIAWPYIDSVFLPDRSKPFFSDFGLPPASEMWESLNKEAAHAEMDCMILSGEDFCLVRDPCVLRESIEGAEIRILVYLRRQDHLLLSIYNEDVKNAVFARTEKFADFQRENRLAPLLDYATLLGKWEQAFGRHSIQVGVYEGKLASHDLLGDFAARIGLQWNDDFWLPTARSNPRIGPVALELKRRFNVRKPSFQQNDVLLDALAGIHEGNSADSGDFIFSDQARNAFLRRFDAGNRIVAERYLGQHNNKTLFDESLPDPQLRPSDSDICIPTEDTIWVAAADIVHHLVSELAESRNTAAPESGPEPDPIQSDPAESGLANAMNIRGEADLFQSGVPYRKNALTDSARDLLKIPETAQDDANLYSMANIAPIYMPFLTALSPDRIVEIGSEKGGNTELLARFSSEIGAKLDVVDPVALPENTHFGDHVIFHQVTSAIYLRTAEPANVYFIDGDHNYKTVSTELSLIESARNIAATEPPMVILIDDVGWPWGRRDLFYDVKSPEINATNYRTDAGPVPWSTQMHTFGFATGYAAVGEQEAGKKTGVLSAVEDFLQAHPGWCCLTMPIFYGLAILWRPNALPDQANRFLEHLSKAVSMFEPIFGTLEWNRLLLYIDRDYAGKLWERQQHEISKQAEKLEQAGQIWKAQQAEIDRLNAELDSVKSSRDAYENEAIKLRSELADVYASKSWLITKPLRILKGIFLQLN